MADHLDAFKGTVQASLGAFPADIHPGWFQRFNTNGKSGEKSGWCQLFPDGLAGVFGDFRAGVSEFWSSTRSSDMTPAERAALRRQVALAKAQREREQRAAWRTSDDRNRFVLRQCRSSVAGDPVHLYQSRRMATESVNVPTCINLHPAMPYIHEGETLVSFLAWLRRSSTRMAGCWPSTRRSARCKVSRVLRNAGDWTAACSR